MQYCEFVLNLWRRFQTKAKYKYKELFLEENTYIIAAFILNLWRGNVTGYFVVGQSPYKCQWAHFKWASSREQSYGMQYVALKYGGLT